MLQNHLIFEQKAYYDSINSEKNNDNTALYDIKTPHPALIIKTSRHQIRGKVQGHLHIYSTKSFLKTCPPNVIYFYPIIGSRYEYGPRYHIE